MRKSFLRCAKMLLLGESDVRRALSLKECLDVNRKALVSLSDGSATVPSRLGLPYPTRPNASPSSSSEAQDWTLIKPAAYYGSNEESSSSVVMGMKVVSVRAQNPSQGLPLVPATVLMLDAATGLLDATISGTYLTVARTSAGPALAVQTFRPDLEHLVLFGAGAQAECHIELFEVAIQRTIPRITIVNRSLPRAEALKEKLQAATEDLNKSDRQEIEILLLDDTAKVNAALACADVVATTTNSSTALWEDGKILKKGCLITSIGSYTPDMQEIPKSAVDRSHVLIDTPEAMDVGDLKHLGDMKTSTHPISLMGTALMDPIAVKKRLDEKVDCIFFKSVGTAIQDVLTAQVLVQRAKVLAIGQEVEMS